MTDHAGPRQCECHPGTNFWHTPIKVTQFGTLGAVLALDFCKAKKDYIDQEAGESMKQKLSEIVQVTVLFHTDLFLFGLSKTEAGAKTAPRVPKLGYYDGRVPKLSSRVTLATSGAGVVCHMHLLPAAFHKSRLSI